MFIAWDEWHDHHQTIQPLFPTILFDTTLGSGIIRIAIAGLQNPDCIPFWWIAPGFEILSKKEDLIADWIVSCF